MGLILLHSRKGWQSLVSLIDGSVAMPHNGHQSGSGSVVFRPQNLVIRHREEAPIKGGTRLEALVDHKEFIGSVIRYRVRIGEQFILADAFHQRGAAAPAEGAPVSVYLNHDLVIQLVE